jgi:hypothetical protein
VTVRHCSRTGALAELYRRKVADLAAALEQPGTREEALLILALAR